jgi:hypothetical protein
MSPHNAAKPAAEDTANGLRNSDMLGSSRGFTPNQAQQQTPAAISAGQRVEVIRRRNSRTYEVIVTREGAAKVIAWTDNRNAAFEVAASRKAELGIREKHPDQLLRKVKRTKFLERAMVRSKAVRQ